MDEDAGASGNARLSGGDGPRGDGARAGQTARVAAALIGIGLIIFLVGQAIAPISSRRPLAGSAEIAFRAYLDRSAPAILDRFGVPGMVISTVVGGAPSRTYAYGFADRERGRPMAADTVFRVASISKSLTARAILQLAQSGQIDLDAPVERYLTRWPLPGSPFPTREVTARRLLDHTAGLNAGADLFMRAEDRQMSTRDVLVRGAGEAEPARLIAPAGKEFLYSAPGFTLLQLMVEELTHRPFQDYMTSEVLEPLGMTSSRFSWDPALRSRTATPYLAGGKPSPVMIPQDRAADALFATAPDLARFIAAPIPAGHSAAGPPASGASAAGELYASAAKVPTLELQGLKLDGPGLGCFIERLADGRFVITNGGYDPGWSSQYYFVPQSGDGIVILTNSEVGQPAIAEILAGWASWRGLPLMQLTQANIIFRRDVAMVLGLLTMISLYFGVELITAVERGDRRLGRFHSSALASSAFEGLAAVAIMVAWMAVRPLVRVSLPTFSGYGAFAISLFAVIMIARLLLPSRPAPPGSIRRWRLGPWALTPSPG